MKALLKKVSTALLVVPALVLGIGIASPVYAACDVVGSGGISQGAECAKPTNAPSELFGPKSIFVTITNIMLFIIGAIAVIMLIIGGIRYVVSAGDQNAVTSAKNTILYAIIGIVVAFLAYAAVNFVSSQLTSGTSTTYQAVRSTEA
ncbi:MAG TPA: pilin [Magnetospirillaceae bacterium]|nr:pilin [Magnetospirillaceae bacterium]